MSDSMSKPSIASALLLIGSAKAPGTSSSEALLTFLAKQLEAKGIETRLEYVARLSHRPEVLFEAIEAADLFVLGCPLYVDALPYLVVQACERVAEYRRDLAERGEASPTAFASIINCGFPEAEQCATALRITELFARDAGLAWRGGLALGGGQPLGGRKLEEAGPFARTTVPALEQAAAALAAGEPIPQEAIELMAEPMIPKLLYVLAGDLGWCHQAHQHGALRKIFDRPLAPDS